MMINWHCYILVILSVYRGTRQCCKEMTRRHSKPRSSPSRSAKVTSLVGRKIDDDVFFACYYIKRIGLNMCVLVSFFVSLSFCCVCVALLQNQRAFQKQDCIFVGKKRVLGKAKKSGMRDSRYYKSVGLGIKTPRTAIEGTYVDKKCPWTGAPSSASRAV